MGEEGEGIEVDGCALVVGDTYKGIVNDFDIVSVKAW